MPRTSLREDQRRLTRQRIADAARLCFYRNGFAETAAEQIAREAGIGRATLYLHFPSKDAILLDLLAADLRGVRALFRDLLRRPRLDADTIRAWLGTYVRTHAEHRDALGLFHLALAQGAAARRLIGEHRAAIVAQLAARLPGLGLSAGDDVGGRTRAMLLLARIDHFTSAAAEQPSQIDFATGLDIVTAEMVDLLGEGAAPRTGDGVPPA